MQYLSFSLYILFSFYIYINATFHTLHITSSELPTPPLGFLRTGLSTVCVKGKALQPFATQSYSLDPQEC